MGLQFIPDAHCKVFGTCKFPFHKVYIQVQVAMVYPFYYYILYKVAECLGIEYKPGFGIWFTFYGHMQFVVMPVPVLVIAFSEYIFVLFDCPAGIVEAVRCVKMLYTCKVYHCTDLGCKIRKVAPIMPVRWFCKA